MFLSNEKILERCVPGEESLIRHNTFIPGNVRQASYDLRLGAASYVVGDDAPIHLDSERRNLISPLPRGNSRFLMTAEFLKVPRDLLGFITLRNTYKMQGLINVPDFMLTRHMKASWSSPSTT